MFRVRNLVNTTTTTTTTTTYYYHHHLETEQVAVDAEAGHDATCQWRNDLVRVRVRLGLGFGIGIGIGLGLGLGIGIGLRLGLGLGSDLRGEVVHVPRPLVDEMTLLGGDLAWVHGVAGSRHRVAGWMRGVA